MQGWILEFGKLSGRPIWHMLYKNFIP